MSEIMRPLPFSTLMGHALSEYVKSGTVFGIRKEKFYRNESANRITLFGTEIDSPIGPAAGPNSQLAQNIVAAYLSGSRFIELKTVQPMDGEELRNCIPRPCINATDEGYNVEWSTELTVQEAFDEYVKAWFLVHVLGRECGLGTGVLFNMSVGYSFDGVKSQKIDEYIEGLKDARKSEVWSECVGWLSENLESFVNFTVADLMGISPIISNSITLSTLHGCPREEIEKIAHYLLTEKKLHTYVKCNPTLLGYESARRIVDEMGYGYLSFDNHHFEEDLQFADAVPMLTRLKDTADSIGLCFGVKITNTFPVEIKRGELPGEEMYMSGRSLFPLSITVAARLSEKFCGKLPISYSGGADRFNIEDILVTGIRPVTLATTILKPGGYERVKQIAEIAEHVIDAGCGAVDTKTLSSLSVRALGLKRYRKDHRITGSRKTETSLPLVDCAEAPCRTGGCPINQQIPAYLEKVARGDFGSAFHIIVNDNVLPSVTGTICDHQCQSKCTRLDYEDSLSIREAKKSAVLSAQEAYIKRVLPCPPASGKKVLVIGAGPAGIASAIYLRRNGIDVTVHEKSDRPMGIVSRVIPSFRISDMEIALDVQLAAAHGVAFEYGVPEGFDLEAHHRNYDYVILATGSWMEGKSTLPIDGVVTQDALAFLEASRASNMNLELGKRVAVIGGGDVAMDCARAAARNAGVEEAVIVYRRVREFMPAQAEEIELAEADGVKFLECLSPIGFADGRLVCDKMALGDYDESGRRSCFAIGETEEIPFDTVINAVGARVDISLFERNGISLGENGHAALSVVNETSIPGVYIAGDCKAGPATVVKAMADAKAIACDILTKEGIAPDFVEFEIETCREDIVRRKGVLVAKEQGIEEIEKEANRCLSCGVVCEICVDVCPNRANLSIDMGDTFAQRHQVVHIDRLCNECGNCGVFCPSIGDPYKDKLTVFSSEEDFLDSTNRGFLRISENQFKIRLDDASVVVHTSGAQDIPELFAKAILIVKETYPWLF